MVVADRCQAVRVERVCVCVYVLARVAGRAGGGGRLRPFPRRAGLPPSAPSAPRLRFALPRGPRVGGGGASAQPRRCRGCPVPSRLGWGSGGRGVPAGTRAAPGEPGLPVERHDKLWCPQTAELLGVGEASEKDGGDGRQALGYGLEGELVPRGKTGEPFRFGSVWQ